MVQTDNRIVSDALEQLVVRLPSHWTAQAVRRGSERYLEVNAGGATGRLALLVFKRLDPRRVRELSSSDAVVFLPYASPAVRAELDAKGLGYVDSTGNVRLVLTTPGLFVHTEGAQSNPWPEKRSLSLKGVKAGRMVEALATSPLPIGVRALAQRANTDPGYVSRLLAKLDREALVDRVGRGQVASVDWRRLLTAWSEDAPLAARCERSMWLAPRGLAAVRSRLPGLGVPYALTGSEVAAGLAPVAPTRMLSIYVEDSAAAAAELGLLEADAGANVLLLEPEDPKVVEGRVQGANGFRTTLPRVVVDLLTGPGRSPAEAAALMAWMEDNPEAWHG